MSREQAEKIVYGELDAIRSATSTIAETLHARTPSFDQWIAHASKRQLYAELIHLLSDNHAEQPF